MRTSKPLFAPRFAPLAYNVVLFASSLALLVVLPLPAVAQQPSAPAQLVAELPDSPSATLATRQSVQPAAPAPSLTNLTNSQPRPVIEARATESNSPVQQDAPPSPEKPVGTAAAGIMPASGIAASQPAGVAIAPAKQHRVRTILIRTGAIIGAGVAVGSVVALTEATPSRPPGAH
jgi:hypothetical protein